jgi:ketosteroid isomerase-like protein
MKNNFNQKFDEAFNKHDAAAVGQLYTANAVQTTPQGSFSGREAIFLESYKNIDYRE